MTLPSDKRLPKRKSKESQGLSAKLTSAGGRNSDGSLDTSFDPNANDLVFAVAVQADGKILVGGDFTSIGGQPRNRIARLFSEAPPRRPRPTPHPRPTPPATGW